MEFFQPIVMEEPKKEIIRKPNNWRTVVGKHPDSCTVIYYESKLNLDKYREYHDQGYSFCFCSGEYDDYTNHYVISNTYIDDSCTEDRVRSTYQVRGFEEKSTYGANVESVMEALNWAKAFGKKKLIILNMHGQSLANTAIADVQPIRGQTYLAFNEYFNQVCSNFRQVMFMGHDAKGMQMIRNGLLMVTRDKHSYGKMDF